jgi:hypothetical protein
VAWRTDAADDTITYCRIAAGGSGCDLTRTLNFPGAGSIALGQAQVFAPETNMVVISAGCTQCTGSAERTFRWISSDNGSSFDVGTEVGDMRFGGEGSYIGGGNMLGVNGGLFQAMSTTVAPLNLGGSAVFSPSTVRGGASEAIYASNDLAAVRYRATTAR